MFLRHSQSIFSVNIKSITLFLCYRNLSSKKMESVNKLNIERTLKSMFLNSVEAVKPKSLFASNKTIKIIDDNLIINTRSADTGNNSAITATGVLETKIPLINKQCHLVGFGKAVLGMAVQIEQLFGDRLKTGILSVPVGTVEKFKSDKNMQLKIDSVIQIYEGAENNLPDNAAENTAKKILKLVSQLNKDDILLVAISGGGSALIPLPISPITLDAKRMIIKQLASREATINELNTVRIAISQTKGGKLAIAAKNTFKTISFIISDVSGDPLDIIASGPTVLLNNDNNNTINALSVLKKYNLHENIPDSIKMIVENDLKKKGDKLIPINVLNLIIGSNKVAVKVASKIAEGDLMCPIVLSTRVEGNVEKLSEAYIKLATIIYECVNDMNQLEVLKLTMENLDEYFKFDANAVDDLITAIKNVNDKRMLCLIAGGEPTVCVNGHGIGGRNQELALRISQLLYAKNMSNIVFLSAGTDGIDGPTNAAGAIATIDVITDWNGDKSVNDFIENNDSYNFYKQCQNGRYHILTGHTGTNVMDLHLMVIPLYHK